MKLKNNLSQKDQLITKLNKEKEQYLKKQNEINNNYKELKENYEKNIKNKNNNSVLLNSKINELEKCIKDKENDINKKN